MHLPKTTPDLMPIFFTLEQNSGVKDGASQSSRLTDEYTGCIEEFIKK